MKLIATSTMGLEAVTARELKNLGYNPKNSDSEVGRTCFDGEFNDLVRANIHLRTAGKILIELTRFKVSDDFDAIFEAVDAVTWEDWMPKNAEILVEARSVRSTITSVPALQRTVKKGIVNRLCEKYRLQRLPENGPKYTVELALLKDQAVLTLDTTGRGLHRRGYRLMNVVAPLRETIAAALIELSFWKPDRPFLDPFCASGTLPIEAALIGRNIPPGLKREFDAQQWPCISQDIWLDERTKAFDEIRPNLSEKIIGSDIDESALELARFHAQKAGVENDIIFRKANFYDLKDSRQFGCIICNPPYGDRLGEQEDLQLLYEAIPSVLSRFPTWSHYIITSWKDLEKLVGRKADRRRKLYNGRIECTYFQFYGPRPPKTELFPAQQEQPVGPESENTEVSQFMQNEEPGISQRFDGEFGSPVFTAPAFAGLDEYSEYQVQEFGRCLTNRMKHLRRYPKRGITCYRLYDRDFPEVPLAIDIYQGEYLHLAEYERPDERTPGQHRLWLDKVTEKAGEILGIKSENIFLKRRKRQRGDTQYEKLSQSGRIIEAQEGGLTFLCNMTDYLDTGLFLDHRITRDWVRRDVKGKRFLNLFCYTGAFTCYAADGGAESTVSVDLSPNYLDWARANMDRNNFIGKGIEHKFIKSDVLKFLRNIPPVKGKFPRGEGERIWLDRSEFDLCVCDPPTFSNSKSTEQDWDIQRQHVELLRLLASRMRQNGVVYFSNNFRRFKLSEDELKDVYDIKEISNRTVPEEFRNKRIHRCWRLFVK